MSGSASWDDADQWCSNEPLVAIGQPDRKVVCVEVDEAIDALPPYICLPPARQVATQARDREAWCQNSSGRRPAISRMFRLQEVSERSMSGYLCDDPRCSTAYF